MVEFIWQQRLVSKRKAALEKRGVKVSKSPQENRAMLKEVEDRGGQVNPQKEDAVGIEITEASKAEKIKEASIGTD